MPILLLWKIKFGLKIQQMLGGNYQILYHKTNKEALTVFCSVVKHLGSSRALKKWGKTLDCVSCFLLHFFHALPLPACFTTEQSTVKASLFVNQFKVFFFFQHMSCTYSLSDFFFFFLVYLIYLSIVLINYYRISYLFIYLFI